MSSPDTTTTMSLTQTFNGIIFPIVATILWAFAQYQIKRRADNHDFDQKDAPWGESWRGHLKMMCLFSSLFGFFHVFSPVFQTSLLAMAVPMVGYLAFHSSDKSYLLAYAVLMIPFATTGSIVAAG